jgi:hypothetical protein
LFFICRIIKTNNNKKLFFTAVAACAFSTATFAIDMKEVKIETKTVSENAEVIKHTPCGAAWIATYDSMIHTTGVTYEQAIAAADRTETACINASLSAE